MQVDIKKVTLSADELVSNVMTYLDFYLQQSVNLIRNTGVYYTYKTFKYDFVKMINESFPTKLTGISKDTNIQGIGKVK